MSDISPKKDARLRAGRRSRVAGARSPAAEAADAEEGLPVGTDTVRSERSRTSARKAAMDLLARREHSRRELEQKLRRRFDACELATAIETLAEEGLQSDERFALSYTRERLLRGYGPRRIEAELEQRGVAMRHIDGALAAVPEEEALSWRDVAGAAEARKFGPAPPADYEEKARRLRFLYRRGFAVDDMGPAED